MVRQLKWTIYCHIHRESGRRYVGLTKATWRQRWNRHVYSAKRGMGKGFSHFANAIRKYGKEAFDHEVLEVCSSLEEANASEEKWINHFDTRDPEKGFNLKKGGDNQPHPVRNPWDRPEYRDKFVSPEARAKMSEIVASLHRDPEVGPEFLRGLETANRNRSSKTQCKNGHEFTPENTKVDAKGWRYCRRCAADRASAKSRAARTACSNGHLFVDGSFKLSRSGGRVCLLCAVTHCKRGHEFTPENTALNGRGSRVCVECRRIRGRKDDAKRRARCKLGSGKEGSHAQSPRAVGLQRFTSQPQDPGVG